MSAPDRDDDARHALEDTLADIEGLSKVLLKLGDESDAGWLIYLAFRLQDHHAAAHDAFSRIFKLDEYREPVTLVQPAAPE